MDFKIILGILTGSLGTLLIKEVFNQINRKIDFERDLKRQIFTKKLDAAERATAFYSTYLNTIIEIKKSIEVIINILKEDSELDLEIIQKTLDQDGSTLTELMKNGYKEANAVHLYFDLDDVNAWNENDITKLIEGLSEAKGHDNNIQLWLDLYNSHNQKGENNKAEFCWDKMMEIIPTYIESLSKVVDSLEHNKLAIELCIKKIKTQI